MLAARRYPRRRVLPHVGFDDFTIVLPPIQAVALFGRTALPRTGSRLTPPPPLLIGSPRPVPTISACTISAILPTDPRFCALSSVICPPAAQ